MDEVNETWITINGVEDYEVSTCGRVRRKKNKRVLSPEWRDNKRGRKDARVSLKDKHYSVSRLVAMNFLPCDIDGMTVNHIDGDLRNNHVSNLEWTPRRTNIRNEIASGSCCRINGPVVLQECGTGRPVQFETVKEAAEFTGCSNGAIRRACFNNGAVRSNDGKVWLVVANVRRRTLDKDGDKVARH